MTFAEVIWLTDNDDVMWAGGRGRDALTDSSLLHCQTTQVAQLSQRDCAMLRVIEYFAKSSKVTQGHSK